MFDIIGPHPDLAVFTAFKDLEIVTDRPTAQATKASCSLRTSYAAANAI